MRFRVQSLLSVQRFALICGVSQIFRGCVEIYLLHIVIIRRGAVKKYVILSNANGAGQKSGAEIRR